MAERGGNCEAAGTLQDVPPDDHGTVIDMTMRDRAQEELREFKRELRAEEPKAAPGPRPHQKDSERRRRLKRQRERGTQTSTSWTGGSRRAPRPDPPRGSWGMLPWYSWP